MTNEHEEELEQRLATLRSVIAWSAALSAANMDGPEVWSWEDPDYWPMSDPQEDYALPPLLLWDADLRRLAQKAYEATYGRFLEPGESFQFAWPPRGSLWTPGIWSRPESDDDLDAGSEQVAEEGDTVIKPASWRWYLGVERVGEDSLEDEQPWMMGDTDVDPRTVEYSVFGGPGAHGYVEVLQKVVERAGKTRLP